MWGHRCVAVGRFAYSRASRAPNAGWGPLTRSNSSVNLERTGYASRIVLLAVPDGRLLVNNDPHSDVVDAERGDCERMEHLVESIHAL